MRLVNEFDSAGAIAVEIIVFSLYIVPASDKSFTQITPVHVTELKHG